MPEHAEIRLASSFADERSRGVCYTKITKSDVSKVKTDLDIFDGHDFWITSESRGKQLKIICHKSGTKETKELLIGFGMSGMFAFVSDTETETGKKVMKHAHLQFHTTQGDILVLHDVRRFAKWKWVEKNGTWATDRGYDPVSEFKQFKQKILDNWKTHKAFESPISTLLMNQRWFNGVGNYLRAEILFRVPDVNPWTPGNQLTETQITNIIDQCEECCETAYQLQKSSNGTYKENIISWKKVYDKNTSSYAMDDNKRKFWFDPKWNSHLPQKYKKDKYLLKE